MNKADWDQLQHELWQAQCDYPERNGPLCERAYYAIGSLRAALHTSLLLIIGMAAETKLGPRGRATFERLQSALGETLLQPGTTADYLDGPRLADQQLGEK